jgi:hypothetical protein
MSSSKLSMLLALALAVGGATSALAQTRGLEDADHASRAHPTPSEIASRAPSRLFAAPKATVAQRGQEDADHASRGHPTPSQWNQWEAVRHSGAYASTGSFAPPYTGGRNYIGTDPDAGIRGQLLRDAPVYRN